MEWLKAKIDNLDNSSELGDTLIRLMKEKTLSKQTSTALNLNEISMPPAIVEKSDSDSKQTETNVDDKK